MNTSVAGTHMIVLPGGGYAEHAPHEAEPVASWLSEMGVQASVFRYPLNVRHPAPLDALRGSLAAGAYAAHLVYGPMLRNAGPLTLTGRSFPRPCLRGLDSFPRSEPRSHWRFR